MRHLADGENAFAESCFREAIRLAPDFAEALTNLAMLLDQSGQTAEAERHYRRSIALRPDYGQTYLNLGVLLARQKNFAQAEAAYRAAIELMPESPIPWTDLGVLQASLKRETEAESSYLGALALDTDYRPAHFNYAYLFLRRGDLAEGWRHFEARNWYAALEKFLPCPRWQGEALAGKSLLIGIEAGHGDMIQFCRYASVLKQRGAANIGIICHPALKTLFARLADADVVISLDDPLPETHWDYWSPPMSLPFHCQTRLDSIPADLPYLSAEPGRIDHWAGILDRKQHPARLYVGLVWKGNPRFENDADRSLPDISVLAELGKIADIRFISLQKGAGEDEAANPPASLPLLNLGPQVTDFADMAAIVANLDLVIAVDTAVAHLAGALGKPCWLLLPDYQTDWRWLTGRTDSPWYPQVMRLFRQPQPGNWQTVVEEVGAALRLLTSESNSFE